MSNVAGTIEQLASELARIFEPLGQRLEDNSAESLLEWLGLRPPDAVLGASDLSGALTTSVTAAATLVELMRALVQAIDQEEPARVVSVSASLLEEIARTVQASRLAANTLQSLSASIPGLSPQQRTELSSFAGEFAERLIQRLLVEYVETRFPQATVLLLATGGIEIHEVQGGVAGSLQGTYTRKTFRFDRATKLLTDPSGLLRETYGWGQTGFDGIALFTALQTLLARKFEIPAQILQPPGAPAILEAFGFNAEVNNSFSPPGLDISLRFPVAVAHTETIPAEDWQVTITTQANLAADLQATLRPLFDVEFDLPTGTVDLLLKADMARANTAAPLLLLGSATGSRLEVQSPGAGVGLEAHFDAAHPRVAITPTLRGALRGGKFVISGAGSDSFIGTLLSGANLESNFDVDLTWNLKTGIAFVGSAALEIAIPAHVALGPLEILALYLRGSLASDGSIPMELSGGFAAMLGPLRASVDRLGITATFRFPRDGGNLGPVDVLFAFKPPSGVGLAVDAGVVKGGGYLFIDTERGEYAGALELTFSGFLSLKAVGLITTKMPDGSPGFSLLIIITAEFGTGIQLGFGFTLLGVGGLLGLNRTMRLQPIAEGIRTGGINSIMFPRDVVANAPRIISDLRNFFPPEEGKFLIGPMAKIGWGTPTLISLSLGIIIEIPGNIAILGVLRVALPTADAALLVLQVSFLGAIEFAKKRLWFFATLFESRVLFITIEGEMGLLVAFGDDANFVVTVGGFHPRFNPPPLPFPSPRRVAFDVVSTPTYLIRVEGYFGVTTNTAQFGARAQLRLGFDDFGIEGHIAFDALFQFSPFYFIIEISASVSLKAFGVGLFSIRLRFALEGPTPWRAKGSGSISLLFFEISADFDFTWGESRETTLPPIAVMPLLKVEFDKLENWNALLPAGNNLLVSLRRLDPAPGNLVLHPVGALRISQKAVPLDLPIDKVGNQKPNDAKRFSVTITSGGLAKKADTIEQFAPAQFEQLDDAARLSRPAFEPEHGGLELSTTGQELASARMVKRNVRYEEIIIDTNFKRFVRRFFEYAGSLFSHFLAGNAVSKSALSRHSQEQLQPFAEQIVVNPDVYVIASQTNNKAATASAPFTSEASARAFLRGEIARDASLADSLHVIPGYEVNTQL